MAYKLIYNPLIDYIRSRVRLCSVMSYSKASMQLLLVNNWVVYCGMQAKSVCIRTYDESKQPSKNHLARKMQVKTCKILH